MVDNASRMHRRLLGLVAALLAVTVAGMIALWPRAERLPDTEEPVQDLVAAVVVEVEYLEGEPDPVMGGSGEIAVVTVEVLDGPDAGQVMPLEVPAEGYPAFRPGERVSLEPANVAGSETPYFIRDFQRLPVLFVLIGLFVAAVLVIGRWHGLRSLLGLAASLVIVVQFIVPAILSGRNPPLVALVGAMAIMIVTLYLTHGVNEMTTSAVVGTAIALTATVGIALLFINRGKITGFASDDAVFARFAVEGLDLRGLVLAGLIVATLGVLDDVTISQASTVFALHDTDRTLPWATLFTRAMKVGRDHIAAVVNTLFLAYAGASLALLVLFSTSGLAVSEIVGSEILAEEIIKTVVGSLGLIAAVPLTTALAAGVAVRRPGGSRPLGGGLRHGSGVAAVAASGSVPGHAEPVEADEDLDDDERAYRAWIRYLGEDPDRRRAEPDDHPGGRPAT